MSPLVKRFWRIASNAPTAFGVDHQQIILLKVISKKKIALRDRITIVMCDERKFYASNSAPKLSTAENTVSHYFRCNNVRPAAPERMETKKNKEV